MGQVFIFKNKKEAYFAPSDDENFFTIFKWKEKNLNFERIDDCMNNSWEIFIDVIFIRNVVNFTCIKTLQYCSGYVHKLNVWNDNEIPIKFHQLKLY